MCPAPTLDVTEDLGDISHLPPEMAVYAICAAIIVGKPDVLKGVSSCSFLYHGQRYTFDDGHHPDEIRAWLEGRNVVQVSFGARGVDKGRE